MIISFSIDLNSTVSILTCANGLGSIDSPSEEGRRQYSTLGRFLIYHAFLLNARQKRETHWHNPSSKIRRVAIFVAPMRILEDILELHCDASGRRNKNARKGEEELKTDHHLDDDSNCNRGTKSFLDIDIDSTAIGINDDRLFLEPA